MTHVPLTVGLGNSLDLILLLDRITIGRPTGGIDNLIGEALGDGLDVAEGRLASTSGHEVDSLVDATERRHVDCLSADNTG